MAVPKKKTTRAARGQRRSHHALKRVALSLCPNCQSPKARHQVCPTCGYYKGRKIVETVKLRKKKTKKQKDANKEKTKVKYKTR